MKSCSKASSKQEDASGGQPGKLPLHWRRREHAATTVYVVHPDQFGFRTVVQQLTGAAPSSPPPLPTTHARHRQAGGGGSSPGGTNAAAKALQHHGRGEESSGGSRGRTLGQMHQECMAWADTDG